MEPRKENDEVGVSRAMSQSHVWFYQKVESSLFPSFLTSMRLFMFQL